MDKQYSDLIDTMNSYLEVLINASENIANIFRTGNEADATTQLIQYIEGLIWLVEAIDTINANGSNLTDVSTKDLNNKLKEMEQAMLNKDYVLLADILEYEMSELLGELKVKFKS